MVSIQKVEKCLTKYELKKLREFMFIKKNV